MFGEEGSHQAAAAAGHDDVAEEDINEIWSTFRLPIPIPKENSRRNKNCDRSKWLLQVVDQLRLLQTMKEQYATTSSTRAVSNNHRRMKGQINLAYSGEELMANENYKESANRALGIWWVRLRAQRLCAPS